MKKSDRPWSQRILKKKHLSTRPSPLREEQFTIEQLGHHAAFLAGQHQIDPQHGANRLLLRLGENEKALTRAYNLVSTAESRQVTPDGEWLLDNFYLIEQQIHAARLHLPKTYSRELPRLRTGPQAGFPRVYSIALELIAHSEGHVDLESVRRFVEAYQTVSPLKLGELWAVPIMLRLGLIESLRRVAEHIARRRQDRDLANAWADRLINAANTKKRVLHDLAEMAESAPPFSCQFVEEFSSRMKGQSPELATVQSWIQHRLSSEGLTREQLQRVENQNQATDQVLIGHSISSLRSLGAMDWKSFVETLSFVEKILRTDPCGIYPTMDFTTRDRYRHCIERLSRLAGRDEIAVAEEAIRRAREYAPGEAADLRYRHVGYYLVDKGEPELENALKIRFSPRRFLARRIQRFPVVAYLGSLGIATAATLTLLWAFPSLFADSGWRLWVLLAPVIVVASQMAITLVNLASTLLVGPRPLPRLDFLKGIPDAERTMVVIPTLLDEAEGIANLLEGLELRYVGNRDPNLTFALLTDFCDAKEEHHGNDEENLRLVREGILTLNERYQPEGPTLFYLFHRPRLWNPHEHLWMGYERKRGKLEQFNALLRGGPREGFSEIIGDLTPLPSIRYVLTLDTDTALPRDAARRLVGTLAHPLNRPRYDAETGRIIEGYAILQPHTPISLTSANRSRFARLSCGEAGVDPYTREISNVYQDLFGEGSYVGKGIYEVDAFRRATEGRFPENLILSHDLVESNYARSALVSDIELQEDCPSSFAAEMSRRHRWIRGDWQIAGWLFPRVLGAKNQRVPNTLTTLGWWKIFDNLRRSLVPPALLFVLAGGWLLVPESAGFWTTFALTLILLPVLVSSSAELMKKPRDRLWRQHLQTALQSLVTRLAEECLNLAALPYRAAIHLDAILVSAGRMPFTRRGLLLWHMPRYAQRNRCSSLVDFSREMWLAPAFALGLGAILAVIHPAELFTSVPILILWFLSPVLAWWISRPLHREKEHLTDPQKHFLRGLARETWRYFETFATEKENWLAPDNFQEVPSPTVASRTSPTNIGMGLLANLSAMDFGYLSPGQLLDRTTKAFDSMDRLVRYRGHFYNWYDTRTLEPLPAFYISSVDSGNLAGSLLTLRAGLHELKDRPVFDPASLAGLSDTLDQLEAPKADKLRALLKALPAETLPATLAWLDDFCLEAGTLPNDNDPEKQWWLCALFQQAEALRDDLTRFLPSERADGPIPTLRDLALSEAGQGRASLRMQRIDDLARRCTGFSLMDFTFLHDPARDLLSIGYNLSDRRLDTAAYDLLASEARLASYILVAQGFLQPRHWFALGRQITTQGGGMALLSWSGSMFEYLMPLIWMPTHEHTLLDETCRTVIDRQIEYGRQRAVPWGVSESCFNLTDAGGIYQYSAFGVPGLGFKRGLADHLVIAPYASALALMVKPSEACCNLQRLTSDGYRGTYGMFEAIDFTPSRLPRGHSSVALRTYMAHHQGMSLLSIGAVLHRRPMQRRFLADPFLKASELLLCERIPKVSAPLQPHAPEVDAARQPPTVEPAALRIFSTPHTALPEVQLLSNGRYHVMVSNGGGGYSRWNQFAVTRWREDATTEAGGTFCYLRDTQTNHLWSSAYQPTRHSPEYYEAIFQEGRAEFRRRDFGIDAHTDIAVSPEHDVEVRRLTLTNLSSQKRTIELTTYAEVVIAPPASDLAHPAFSNLFVLTEILNDLQAILCTRRARAPGENPPWMFHLITTQGATKGEVSYETNRSKFLGRTRGTGSPLAFDQSGPLSNTAGPVLDPIVAIRQAVVMDPDTSANWHVITGMAETREGALTLIRQYRDPSFAARAFEMAWSHSQLELYQMQATEAETQIYARLAGSIIFANPLYRAPESLLTRNRIDQSGLWAFGLSGDLPIFLLRIADVHRINLVEKVLQAHAYWLSKGLETDLVILNEDFSGYRQLLHDRILSLIAAGRAEHRLEKRAGIFVRRSQDLNEEERILLQTVARVIITDGAETLAQQAAQRTPPGRKIPRLIPSRSHLATFDPPLKPIGDLIFFNGKGGFTNDGHEYVIQASPSHPTPAPWSNVIANPHIGTVISESGAAYTWVDNSHAFRLTPWHNDPVSDPSGEAFYLRDEETGRYWSPTPLPAPGKESYTCRHGFGYSVFSTRQHGIASELKTYVAADAPVKFMILKIRNASGHTRRLSATGYCEWVLGQWRHANHMHIVTSPDPVTGALFARNAYNRPFAGKTVFVAVNDPSRSVTGSRAEFIGRNGTTAQPAAMANHHLSGQLGAGLDPCAALQVTFDLADGAEREIVFLLGAGQDADEARQLVQRFCGPARARRALDEVHEFWKHTLSTVQIETPDPALNFLVNGWLEYQTLSCRYWGRSGYYQSGGAYGFRDQLQDTTALLHAAPWTAREHLLRAAARQFIEGDVQHWWHPPAGRGVRTHFSDDYLWLPYCACRYVKSTGDTGVLDEGIPYLEGRPVNADEESYYDLPQRSEEIGTLYEHCQRAIRNGLRFGKHGLPLIGCGDWNDGMNLIGEKGEGESVWLAFFLCDVLGSFAELAGKRGDHAFAAECTREAAGLRGRIEAEAWDGDWYRRAYFDDGTPLGSKENEECQIDSIAQSWAVLSGAGDPDRSRRAMDSVEQRLVRREDRIIQLFDPPFDKSALEPGYIKGYIPGVRENGGQYTHAAIWTAMAFAELGETEKAWELFNLLNPIRHAIDAAGVERYKVEPYVVAADIYSVEPNIGRGGWSWYTGSSGWMYRLIVETLLGVQREGEYLRLSPRLPAAWLSLKIHYRFCNSVYHIAVQRADRNNPPQVLLDGKRVDKKAIPLVEDSGEHNVALWLD